MNEVDWLSSDKPQLLRRYLESVKGKRSTLTEGVSKRKLRLLSCACVRRAWNMLTDGRSRKAIEVAERFADGLATQAELEQARMEANRAYNENIKGTGRTDWDVTHLMNDATQTCFAPYSAMFLSSGSHTAKMTDRLHHNDLVRDVFGNPFRPVRVDEAWLRWNYSAVPKIAQAIYEEQRFESLPVLADALEEAGCANDDIISHCRGLGPHVRGCWVLDLLLGKT